MKFQSEPLLYNWRVTKYDPANRAPTGAYLVPNEWTSIDEVGTVVNGGLLTFDEYRKWEDAYVTAATTFVDDGKLDGLYIRELQEADHERRSVACNDIGPTADLVDYGIVSRRDLEPVVRMNLRELRWCKLEVPGRFYIHFGWDYYMYIGSDHPSTDAIRRASELGLFVEDFISPYLSE